MQTQMLLFDNTWFLCHDCAECGGRVKDDDAIKVDGIAYCPRCADKLLVQCEKCGNYANPDDCGDVFVAGRYSEYRDTEVWCENCKDAHGFNCDACGDYACDSGRIVTADGNAICVACYNDDYFTCDGCGDVFHNNDLACCDDACYCRNCHQDDDNGDFDPGFFRSRGRITEAGSARCYGIEVETNACSGYYDLEDHPAWGAKDDCTVSGKEFYSGILSGDDGLAAIRSLADLADRNGWEVGMNCGFHLHIDARNEDDDSLFAMAYAFRAAQGVFLGCVEEHRWSGCYSHTCNWDCSDLDAYDSFDMFAAHNTRYNWLNLTAYNVHTTFEIRAHEATCDGKAICNWVKACTRFADWAATVGFDGVRDALDGKTDAELFDFIAREAWQDDTLRAYYADKANRLHGYTW